MRINCTPKDRFGKELLLAAAPTLIALFAQKGLDEISDYFRRRREEKLQVIPRNKKKDSKCVECHNPNCKNSNCDTEDNDEEE